MSVARVPPLPLRRRICCSVHRPHRSMQGIGPSLRPTVVNQRRKIFRQRVVLTHGLQETGYGDVFNFAANELCLVLDLPALQVASAEISSSSA